MNESEDPHLAKHFAALNDAALLDALARRSEYTAAAFDVAREEASRRGLHLPESKRPWAATPAPPTPRAPVITVWSIAIALTYVVTFFELSRRIERPSAGTPGWFFGFFIEVAILAASCVGAVVGVTFGRVRHLAVGMLLGILLSYPACRAGRKAASGFYPRLKVTQILVEPADGTSDGRRA
jgi:hypothetical protein